MTYASAISGLILFVLGVHTSRELEAAVLERRWIY